MYKLTLNRSDFITGCILGAIAHAIWSVRHTEFKYMQYWDSDNFHIKNMEGAMATVTFSNRNFIGMLFNTNDNDPILIKMQKIESDLVGIPDHLLKIAEEETIHFFLQDTKEGEAYLISSFIWNENEDVYCNSIDNSCLGKWQNLIGIHLKDKKTALEEWKIEYNLSDWEFDLMRFLYQKRCDENKEYIEKQSLPGIDQILNTPGEEIFYELLNGIKITLV